MEKPVWRHPLRWPQWLLTKAVLAYRLLWSPWVGGACRFEPTCSLYALQSLDRHGAMDGSLLTVWRLARCQPFCRGGHDPVPASGPIAGLFTGLLSRDRYKDKP